MPLKDSLGKLIRIPAELAPQLVEAADHSVEEVRERLARFNSVLAEKALPDDRRKRVNEMSLHDKAVRAGQRPAPPADAEESRKLSNS